MGINGQMAGYRETKKAIQERLSELNEKRKEQLGDMPEILEKKDAIQKKIQEKIVERNTLRDEFSTAKRAFQEYLSEQQGQAGEVPGGAEVQAGGVQDHANAE